LNDLSPAATFISYNYNTPVDVIDFEDEARRILIESEEECGWVYEVQHSEEESNPFLDFNEGNPRGKINYTVWSDLFVCPNCSKELVFWDVAVDKSSGSVSEDFSCSSCLMMLKKKDCERAQETVYDKVLEDNIVKSVQVPVWLNYSVGMKKHGRKITESDYDVIRKIEDMDISYWFPSDRMIIGTETRRNDKFGVRNVHHFYTKRNLYVLSSIYDKIQASKHHKELLMLMFTSQLINISKLNRYRPQVSFPYNPLSGTMYMSSMISEANIFKAYSAKIKRIVEALDMINERGVYVSNGSLTNINVEENSIDYIFTDPPFGNNLNYSELSFIWESWLKVITNNKLEAIINPSQKKGLLEYQQLMESCFLTCYRILKPGRWMTVEFHNSQNSVWNAIQEALLRAGFIVADVRTLDKQQGSFKQVTNTSAVKQDLVISAYKPKEIFKRRFLEHAGSEEAVWEFVRQHLVQLPVFVINKDKLEIVTERQNFLLFDRMVAYHIMNGISVPIDASDFYKGLKERFIPRDSMYFLSDQVNEYDNKRVKMDVEPIQMSMMVVDEKSAIAWLYAQLETPQTRQDLLPKFMQELHQLKHEVMPELDVILNENFLQDDVGKWYVADLNKQSDLDKLRNKRLLKDYEEYVKGTGKLKIFRTEAIRAGFDHAWKQRDFAAIVNVGKRLPEKVIQEDPALLMYYDNALSRME